MYTENSTPTAEVVEITLTQKKTEIEGRQGAEEQQRNEDEEDLTKERLKGKQVKDYVIIETEVMTDGFTWVKSHES